MLVGFDARMIEASGIGTHIRGLLQAMLAPEMAGPRQPQFLLFGNQERMRKYPFLSGQQLREWNPPIYGLLEQLTFPGAVRADLFHFPHYAVPRMKQPFCVTVHDLIHLIVPEVLGSPAKRFYAKHLIQSAVNRARFVFTVSEWSRNDLVTMLHVKPEKIVVVPNAVADWFQPLPDADLEKVRQVHRLPARFLLSVGVNKPHKNFPFLIRSFAAWKGSREFGLVICGVDAAGAKELTRIAEEAGVGERLHILAYLGHDALATIYQSAEALVFPSLYEGFGIPVLEAQRVGTPVLSSSASSLPEVAGDAAIYFEPTDPTSLHNALDKLLSSDREREELVERGYQNERRFRWSDAARLTLDTYEAVAAGRA